MNIGKAIVSLREEKDISQNKLAKLTGLNRGYIYKLENNKISPTVATLEKIVSVIGINLSDLIKFAENSSSDDR